MKKIIAGINLHSFVLEHFEIKLDKIPCWFEMYGKLMEFMPYEREYISTPILKDSRIKKDDEIKLLSKYLYHLFLDKKEKRPVDANALFSVTQRLRTLLQHVPSSKMLNKYKIATEREPEFLEQNRKNLIRLKDIFSAMLLYQDNNPHILKAFETWQQLENLAVKTNEQIAFNFSFESLCKIGKPVYAKAFYEAFKDKLDIQMQRGGYLYAMPLITNWYSLNLVASSPDIQAHIDTYLFLNEQLQPGNQRFKMGDTQEFPKFEISLHEYVWLCCVNVHKRETVFRTLNFPQISYERKEELCIEQILRESHAQNRFIKMLWNAVEELYSLYAGGIPGNFYITQKNS